MGGALGQGVGFQSVSEFEAWIAEAEKGNKDPVDWALDKGKGEDWASKLDAYLVKRKLARADGELARAKADGARLDAALMEKTKTILAAMKTLEAQGRLGPDAVADLNKMAQSHVPEVRELIRREFGKYLKP
jgi:hypothetical protein